MNFKIGDVLFFKNYTFTDKGEIKNHFAFVLVPSSKSENSGQIYCAVITSKEPSENCYFKIESSKYNFLPKDSYICFLRQDLQSLSDISTESKQPVGSLEQKDIEKCFEFVKEALYSPLLPTSKMSKFLKSVLMREWEKACP